MSIKDTFKRGIQKTKEFVVRKKVQAKQEALEREAKRKEVDENRMAEAGIRAAKAQEAAERKIAIEKAKQAEAKAKIEVEKEKAKTKEVREKQKAMTPSLLSRIAVTERPVVTFRKPVVIGHPRQPVSTRSPRVTRKTPKIK